VAHLTTTPHKILFQDHRTSDRLEGRCAHQAGGESPALSDFLLRAAGSPSRMCGPPLKSGRLANRCRTDTAIRSGAKVLALARRRLHTPPLLPCESQDVTDASLWA
jgi:hypothetical protein